MEIRSAYAKIEIQAKAYVDNAPLVPFEEFEFRGNNSKLIVTSQIPILISDVCALLKESETDFVKDINAYLADLESSPVRTLKELITFNEDHAREELPPGESSLYASNYHS